MDIGLILNKNYFFVLILQCYLLPQLQADEVSFYKSDSLNIKKNHVFISLDKNTIVNSNLLKQHGGLFFCVSYERIIGLKSKHFFFALGGTFDTRFNNLNFTHKYYSGLIETTDVKLRTFTLRCSGSLTYTKKINFKNKLAFKTGCLYGMEAPFYSESKVFRNGSLIRKSSFRGPDFKNFRNNWNIKLFFEVGHYIQFQKSNIFYLGLSVYSLYQKLPIFGLVFRTLDPSLKIGYLF